MPSLVSALRCLPATVSTPSRHFDVQILLAEAGDRERDAVMVLVGALDVVGRIGLAGSYWATWSSSVEQPVEADGRTEKGVKSNARMVISSWEATWVGPAIWPGRLCPRGAIAPGDNP